MNIWIVKFYDVETTASDVFVYLFKNEEDAIAYIDADIKCIKRDNSDCTFKLERDTVENKKNYVLECTNMDYWWEWDLECYDLCIS